MFLLRGFHGQRSLVGCSAWGCKETDTTEVTELTSTCTRGPGSYSMPDSANGNVHNKTDGKKVRKAQVII